MNFTFDGLTEATNAIERLRTFHQRLLSATVPLAKKVGSDGGCTPLQSAAQQAEADYIAALANDLNTADARAPIFELVRAANTALDRGEFCAGDREAILKALASFDAVFDVIEDRDAEPTRRALAWAEQAGRMADVAPELRAAASINDDEINALVAERDLAKKRRDFAKADQIRKQLAEKGIVIEDSKEGTRWKRK